MKIKKYISLAVVSAAILFGTQSCFQDLDNNPPFNYPEEPEAPEVTDPDLLLKFDFEDNVDDLSSYQFTTTRSGNNSFADGIIGRAYRGEGDKPYIIARESNSTATAELADLGSFTVAFWMNSPKNTGATSIISVSHPERFWGNLEIFMENNNSDTEAFFKVYLFNTLNGGEAERWSEIRIPDTFGQWVHLAFAYDGNTSTLSVYKNGERIAQNALDGMGRLLFNPAGPVVIGTTHFMTDPSLTSSTGAQDWAGYFTGSLDQFYFYKKALNDSEVKELYDLEE